MEEFCAQEGIAYRICGKVIVAHKENDLPKLKEVYERGKSNGISCELISRSRLLELEPHVAGIKAVHVHETGIVDYKQVCERLAVRIKEQGHQILTSAKAFDLKETDTEVVVRSTMGDFSAKYIINCGGLHSDRLASLGGHASSAKIIPFRGEYFKLKPEAQHLCNNLIYPVPDPKFPFLGVHFTRMISGAVECGPNAVLAFAREGYRKADINIADLFETMTYPGFLRLITKYWRMGLSEMWRSISKASFVRALQCLIPKITGDQLVPAPAGIRAQAVAPGGMLLDDFCFHERPRVLNVVNAPSPAATASLSIGKLIVETLAQRF